MLTPEELRQIRRLHVQLGRRVDSPLSGDYRSAFRGRGMEFEEVRPYVPGDDVRHIDWNVTARTDAPHIKEFREERELTLMLVVDVSASMRFGSGTSKRLQVARIAGALALAAVRSSDRVGLISFARGVEHYLPPRKKRGHAWAVLRAAFEDSDGTGPQTDLAGALERLGRTLRRRAVVCILSDFIAPAAYLREVELLSRRHDVSAFLVTDPLEESLPAVGLLDLADAETGARSLVDTAALRARAPVTQRLDALRRAGARARHIPTTVDPILDLHQHFQPRGGRRR